MGNRHELTSRKTRRSSDYDQKQRPSRSLPSEFTSEERTDTQWSTSASTWQQIGQVVDAIGSGRKQLYEGKEYDYVFDVDVQEGVPPLKLPYNISGMLPFFS